MNTKDKKLSDQIHRKEKIEKITNFQKHKAVQYLEQEGEGFLIPEAGEKTLKFSQKELIANLPKYNRDNIFDLSLESGPYHIDFTRNGSNLLMCGEKGHISMLNWRTKNLDCELFVNEKIRCCTFLHNETMFAVGQRKRLYIYDRQGIELHALDYHKSPKFLQFLPYHYLLVSASKTGMIKYQDVSMGKIISEIKTKNSEISAMTQNPYNAVVVTGHSNGVINMFTPNFSEPIVKMLAHPSTINCVAVNSSGNTLISTGLDGKMRIWDLRTYKQLYEYFNPLPASALSISQKDLLAVSHGNIVEIWKDFDKSKQKEPYMKHHFSNNQTRTKSMKFVNFEDFLGIGTNLGYSSIIVPGSGEANFDSFENNPYQTKKQRQSSEIKSLLEKIPAEMITLEPNNLNRIDQRSKAVIDKERKEEIRAKTEELMETQKKKMKKRLKNKEKHDEIIKEFNRNQNLKNKLRSIIEIKTEKQIKEKEAIKKDMMVLNNLAEDFDPELYLKEKEDEDGSE